MRLEELTGRLGDYTKDCILITEAEPLDRPGPRIVWCNRAFTDMTGYTLDEIKGKTPRLLQGEDTSEEARNSIREKLKAWSPVRCELVNYTKAGEPFWVDLSIMPVADETGWFHYWVSVQRDVTARKEAELTMAARNDALERAQKRLKTEREEIAGIAAVAEHAKDLITVTDVDFRVIWANPAFLQKAGFALSDIVGLYHCDVITKRSQRYPSRTVAVKAILGGNYRADEVRNIDRNGLEFWTDMSVSVLRDINGRPTRFVIVERDVTEQRALRLEIERHRDHLHTLVEERTATVERQAEEIAAALEAEKELNGLQRQFVSMVSHELRTPLAIIGGRSHILRRKAERLTAEDVAKACGNIDRAIWRLTELIESVLQSAKLEHGGIEFAPSQIDLDTLLAEAASAAAEIWPEHTVKTEFAGDLSDVWGDATLLSHCVTNLLSNAGKYSDAGSTITLRARREGAGFVLSVSDEGVGIPPDELGRLFQRFFRASTSAGRPGTGIGLHLVQHFVAMHGGHVDVESDLGVGTTFTVTVPGPPAVDRTSTQAA